MADILPPAPVDAPFTSYNWADWYKKVRDAINSGASVAWASITGKPTTVAGIALTDLSSGTYTPTLTGSFNVDGTTAYTCQYLRVGAVVTVSGALAVDPTATGTTTVFITLPVSSNLTNTEQVGGTAICRDVQQYGAIYADTGGDRAALQFTASDTTSKDWWFTFTYRVL